MNVIFKRKSVRKYTDQPVSDEIVEQLLRAAMAAPSAGNEQPWEFIVMRDRKTMAAVTAFHPYAKMLLHADVAIVVCGNLSREVYGGFWVQDCSAATQNILLEAERLGLGAVWLGIHPLEERVDGVTKLLGLPDGVIPLSIVPVGYPAQEKQAADRFDRSRIRYDHW